MGYYRGGGVTIRFRHAHRTRTGYYMAGGFFSKLKKGFKKAVNFATHTQAGNLLLGAAAGAVGLGGAYALAGRVAGMFSHTSAPSGVPTEGTPPLAPAADIASHKSANADGVHAYWLGIVQHMSAARRRRLLAILRSR